MNAFIAVRVPPAAQAMARRRVGTRSRRLACQVNVDHRPHSSRGSPQRCPFWAQRSGSAWKVSHTVGQRNQKSMTYSAPGHPTEKRTAGPPGPVSSGADYPSLWHCRASPSRASVDDRPAECASHIRSIHGAGGKCRYAVTGDGGHR